MEQGVDLFFQGVQMALAKDQLASEHLGGEESGIHWKRKGLYPVLEFIPLDGRVPGQVPAPVPETGNILMKGQDFKSGSFQGSADAQKAFLGQVGGGGLDHHDPVQGEMVFDLGIELLGIKLGKLGCGGVWQVNEDHIPIPGDFF